MNTSTFVTSRKELLDRTSPLPAYQQIANDIVLRISQQEWQIDDKLPSEAELAADYGVSRVTLRQAMGQLEQEGIIARFQGKGAFVTNNPRQLVQELTFPSLDSTNKRSVKSKVLLMEQVTAPNPTVEKGLKVTKATPLLYIQRLFYHSDRPSGINHIWFKAADVPGLTTGTLLDGSVSKTLKLTYHYEIASIENYIECVRLDALTASLLNSAYDSTGLRIDSQYLLEDQIPVEYSSTTWLGDFTRFHLKIDR